MGKPRLFVTQPIEASALKRLQEVMEVEVHPDASRPISKEDLIQGVRRNDYLFIRLHDRVDGEIMDANPGLKLIATMASSPGAIDVEAANQRKIPLTGRKQATRDAIFEEVADLTFGLMIAVARKIVQADRLARTTIFPGCQSPYITGAAVYGKTLGIVGMGKVGKAVARRAKGFNMEILYYDIHPNAEIEERLEATCTSLEDLLKRSDYVSLHPALTPETRHMIGVRELSLMKPSAYLINTARGLLVDQAALIKALESNEIAGAGLDVFESENSLLPGALVELDNVVLTPHIGSGVADKREIMTHAVVDRILRFLEGNVPPDFFFNPEIFNKGA